MSARRMQAKTSFLVAWLEIEREVQTSRRGTTYPPTQLRLQLSPTPTSAFFSSLTQKTTVAIIFFEGAMIHKIREARKAFNCNLPPRAFCDFCNTVNIFMSPKEQKQVVVFANLSTRESFNCNLGGVLIATTCFF